MKSLVLFAIIICAWFQLAPAHAQFNGCSSFCGTSSSAIADAPGFNNAQGSGSGSTLACTYTPVTTGTQNVAYTGATPSASGGVPAYTFSETGSLPTGLSINTSTGVISGTPSVSGSFTGIQVKVADTVPTTVNCGASFTLVIAAPPLMLDGITTGIKAAYSTRQLLTAYAGNAIQIERLSDSTTQNIGFTSNVLNTSAISTFCSGTTCRVITWYDQSGGGFDLTQATFANAPFIYQSGAVTFINSTRPALNFDNSANLFLTNASLVQNPVNTLFQNAVVAATGATDSAITGGTIGNNLEWRVDNTAKTMSLLADINTNIFTSTLSQASGGSVLEVQYLPTIGPAAGSFWVDGAAAGTTTNGHVFTGGGQFQLGYDGPPGDRFAGKIGEYVAYDLVGGIPSGSRISIESNQKAYWGTP